MALDWSDGFAKVKAGLPMPGRPNVVNQLNGFLVMIPSRRRSLLPVVIVLLLVGTSTGLAVAGKPPARHVMTLTDIDRQLKELSNWGRWGGDDELGALNLITSRMRRRAARLVKRGGSSEGQ